MKRLRIVRNVLAGLLFAAVFSLLPAHLGASCSAEVQCASGSVSCTCSGSGSCSEENDVAYCRCDGTGGTECNCVEGCIPLIGG